MITPASALYWFPRIEKAGLPVPGTRFVPYDHQAAMVALEEGRYQPATEEAAKAVRALGGYPVFVRTDLSSAKHDGPGAYKATSADDLGQVLAATVEDNEGKFWLYGPHPEAFMLRQWLSLETTFRAFRGHPIAREWRLFTDRYGKAACGHFYWPREAIHGADEPDWEARREVLAAPLERAEWEGLKTQAAAAAMACFEARGEWSVDFARDTTGRWWLIDMAPAEQSWHPEHGETSDRREVKMSDDAKQETEAEVKVNVTTEPEPQPESKKEADSEEK